MVVDKYNDLDSHYVLSAATTLIKHIKGWLSLVVMWMVVMQRLLGNWYYVIDIRMIKNWIVSKLLAK